MRTHRTTSREPSQRQLRVGEQLRHIIAETMQRGHFHDAILMDAGKITVTEVRVSPDLKNARAYIMPLGGNDMDVILPALNAETHVFQKEINRQSSLKFTPKIHFVGDESFDEADKIEALLRGIHTGEESE